MLASLLADRVERPVHDKTGISGQFDIQLQWVPDGSSETLNLYGMQEQLGLRLQTERSLPTFWSWSILSDLHQTDRYAIPTRISE
jgi:uncharacterized protein (TIGR03435 family)